MRKNKQITKKPPDNKDKPRRKLYESWHSQEFYVNKFAEVLQYLCDQEAFKIVKGSTTSKVEEAEIVDHTVRIYNQDNLMQNRETQQNEEQNYQPSDQTFTSSSPFDTDLTYPPPTIHDYLQWIYKHLNAPQQNFVLIPMAYLFQLVNLKLIQISHKNVHKLVLCAIVTAVKFYNDNFFSNEFYARLGQVSFKELCYMQTKFLLLIDFNLHVSDRQLYFLEHQVRHFSYNSVVELSTASEHHSSPNLESSQNLQAIYSDPCERAKLKFLHLSSNRLNSELQEMWEQKNYYSQFYTSCCNVQNQRCICFIKKQINAYRKRKKKMQQGIQTQDQAHDNLHGVQQTTQNLLSKPQFLRRPEPRPPGLLQSSSERTILQLNPTRIVQSERNQLSSTSNQSQDQRMQQSQSQTASSGISDAYRRLGQQLNCFYEYGCCSGSSTHEQSLIALGISDHYFCIADVDMIDSQKKKNPISQLNSGKQELLADGLVSDLNDFRSNDILYTEYDDQFVLCRQQKIPTNAGIAASILIIGAYIIMHAKQN